MKQRSQWMQMMRIGRAAGARAEGGLARFAALVAATVLLTLTFGSFVATHATYQGRDIRSAARAPIVAGTGDQARAVWSSHWDSFQGRQFTVVVASPLDGQAPLPPGLAQWPAPGEAILSPALAAGPEAEDFPHRYGKFAGVIGEEGLASPGERFVYVRPTPELLSTEPHLTKITGFGDARNASFGDTKLLYPEATFYPFIGVLLLLPILALTVTAARMGSEGRDRRAALLRVLGAGRRARACMDLGEALVPVALGAVVGAAVFSVALLRNVRLPWIDYLLSATDLRQSLIGLALSLVLAVAVVLGLVVLLQPSRRTDQESNRPRASKGGVLRLLAVGMCPAFAVLSWFSGPLFGGARISTIVYLVAAAGILATLPSVIAWLSERTVRALGRLAKRSSKGPALIAVRVIAARPGAIVRLVAALVVAIGVVGQTQLLSSAVMSASGDMKGLQSAEGRTMAIVQGSKSARLDDAFFDALPPGSHVVAFGAGKSGGMQVQAPCGDLRVLELPCPTGQSASVPQGELDRRLRKAVFEFFGPASPEVRVGEVERLDANGPLWLAVFSDGQRALDIPGLKRAVFQHVDVGANIKPLAEGGGASFQNGYQSRWLTFFGAIGGLVLLGAMGLGALAEFLRFGSGMAPLSVLTSNSRIMRSTAAWVLGVPILLAGVAGVVAHLFMAAPRIDNAMVEKAEHSPTLYAAMLAVTALLAVAAAWAGGSIATGKSREWTPRAD